VVYGYEQQAGAKFEELIGACGNGELVGLFGGITLDAGPLLDINLVGGFEPSAGETFDIMDSIAITGEFADAPSSGFDMDGWDWSIDYLPGEIDLKAVNAVSGGGGGSGTGSVPETSSLALFGAGLIVLAGLSVRRRVALANAARNP